MLALLAKVLVVLFGLWLIAVAAVALLRPEVARRTLANMASTPLIHFGEHALRFVAGCAFYVAGPRS